MLHLCSSLPFPLRLCSASRRLLGPAHLSGPLNGGRKVRVCHKVCARSDPPLPHVLHRTNAAGDAADQAAARSAAQSALGGLCQQFPAQEARRVRCTQQRVQRRVSIALHKFFRRFFSGVRHRPGHRRGQPVKARQRCDAVKDAVRRPAHAGAHPHVPHHLPDADLFNARADCPVPQARKGCRPGAASSRRHIGNAAARASRRLFRQQQAGVDKSQRDVLASALCRAVGQLLQVAQAQTGFLQVFAAALVYVAAPPVEVSRQPVDLLRAGLCAVEHILDRLRRHRQGHGRRAGSLLPNAGNRLSRPAVDAVGFIKQPAVRKARRRVLDLFHRPPAVIVSCQVRKAILPAGILHPLHRGRKFPVAPLFQPLVILPPAAFLFVHDAARIALHPVSQAALARRRVKYLCRQAARQLSALFLYLLVPVRRLVLQLSAALHHAHQAVQQPAGFLVLPRTCSCPSRFRPLRRAAGTPGIQFFVQFKLLVAAALAGRGAFAADFGHVCGLPLSPIHSAACALLLFPPFPDFCNIRRCIRHMLTSPGS